MTQASTDPEVTTHPASEQIAVDISRNKKKKKKKYSRGMKAGQEIEIAVTRGGHRLATAIGDGLDSWRSNRNKSARKKRDGAIRDALRNYGRSLSEFGRVAAKIPEDVTNAWPKLSKLFR